MKSIKKKIDMMSGILGIVATSIAIVSAAISVRTYLATSALREHIEAIAPLGLRIAISSPDKETPVKNFVVELKGQVSIQPTYNSLNRPDVNLELLAREVELIPFVRPLSGAGVWYAQTKPSIAPDGSFTGSIYLGESNGPGENMDYQVVVCALPAGTVQEGDKYPDLPASGSASPLIKVHRVDI